MPKYVPKQTQCDAFIDEGLVRLDLLFVSPLEYPAVTPMDIKLTDDAMKVVMHMIAELLGVPVSAEAQERMSIIRECIKDAVP
jgi:hypothetical protein